MCAKSSPSAVEVIRSRLASSRRLLVVTHARPDGDGLGAMVALARSALQGGRTAEMLVPDKVPGRYEFLFAEGLPAGADRFAELADAADQVVVLDTCSFSQLDGLEQALAARKEKVVVLDHHATADDVGAVRWIDVRASSTGAMVFELLASLGWTVDRPVAEALATAIASDTGWLRFANTDARALNAVAELLATGLRLDELYARLYQSDRPERLRLMARMLASLELRCGGRLAAMTIRQPDFDASGAMPEETENLVNEALRIGSVETVILLVENGDCVRASLRSRDAVDVSAVAKRFGGGGHARAAGLRLAEDIDALKQRLMAACEEELRNIPGGRRPPGGMFHRGTFRPPGRK